jgi:SAM-dependent methyltransferase
MNADGSPPALKATGERLVPELQHGELVHAEHLARYLVAARLAGSRRVLDVACGTGYGTAILAASASSAAGVDIDEATVEYARARHPGPTFSVADAAALPFGDGSFDLVVSFETIEHVPDPERVLAELRRVLTHDGLLVVSTPNKDRYLVENEFHQREFTHAEFVALLNRAFSHVQLLLQHNWSTSAVLAPDAAAEASGERRVDVDVYKVAGIEPGGELYTVAICAAQPQPIPSGVAVTAGADESHELARRLVEAERTAESWHAEFKQAELATQQWHGEYDKARGVLERIYSSPSWRLTRPLRGAKRLLRRGRG